MAKAKRNIGIEILQGIREIKRARRGRITNFPSIARVRERTGLSQAKFAYLIGVPRRTLQAWEEGRGVPSGIARTLIMIAHENPQALVEIDLPTCTQLAYIRTLKGSEADR